MTDVVTSRQSDVDDSSVNATTATTVTGNLAGHVSPANPVIVRVTILVILTIFNLGGNGFTLITIRLTPRLWTKTNFVLASMLVSDVMTGLFMLWYTPFLLVVFVFNNPCRFNVAVTVAMSLLKIPGAVSICHLILTSIERYIAIVHPLKYETKFTDRVLKLAIAAAWVTGIFMAMTWSFWLINADLRKCDLVPGHFYLTDVVLVYIPVCVSMIFVYAKILAIWWRQRKRVHPSNTILAPGTSGHTVTVSSFPPTQSNNADNTQDTKKKPMTSTGPHTEPAATNVVASADVAEQRRQIKSRRHEFKAVYLSAAIVGAFLILWFPNMLGRILASAGYNEVVVNYLFLAGGALGSANFAFSWVIYAAVSKSYRRAYRQLLTRIGCCYCCKNVTPQGDISLIA